MNAIAGLGCLTDALPPAPRLLSAVQIPGSQNATSPTIMIWNRHERYTCLSRSNIILYLGCFDRHELVKSFHGFKDESENFDHIQLGCLDHVKTQFKDDISMLATSDGSAFDSGGGLRARNSWILNKYASPLKLPSGLGAYLMWIEILSLSHPSLRIEMFDSRVGFARLRMRLALNLCGRARKFGDGDGVITQRMLCPKELGRRFFCRIPQERLFNHVYLHGA